MRGTARVTVASTVLAAMALAPAPAAAALLPVDITTDTVADDGNCSLREAVTAANTNADVFPGGVGGIDCDGGAGTDVIQLGMGTYQVGGMEGENGNASGDLDVDLTMGSVTFDGVSQGDTTIAVTGYADRILHFLNVGSGTVQELTLIGGFVSGATEGGGNVKVEGNGNLAVQRARVTEGGAHNGAGGGNILSTGSGVISVIDSRVDSGGSVGMGTVQGGGDRPARRPADRHPLAGGPQRGTRRFRRRGQHSAARWRDPHRPGRDDHDHRLRGFPQRRRDAGPGGPPAGRRDQPRQPGAPQHDLAVADRGQLLTGGFGRIGAGVHWFTPSPTNSILVRNTTFAGNNAGASMGFGGAISAFGGVIAFER